MFPKEGKKHYKESDIPYYYIEKFLIEITEDINPECLSYNFLDTDVYDDVNSK